MRNKAIWLAPLAASLLPAPALAQGQGNYHVRNDTRMTLDCGLRRERGSMMERFTLRPGGDGARPKAAIGRGCCSATPAACRRASSSSRARATL